MKELHDLLKELENILATKGNGYVALAEARLAEIAAVNDPVVIKRLFNYFDDTECDELMFSIIHTVERWDDEAYCRALLESVVSLWHRAPKWAQIVHIRVVNSSNTFDTYCDMLKFAPDSVRGIVRDVYRAVSRGWPKLAERVAPIIKRLEP